MVLSRDNVRVISAEGDVEIVGADKLAKLSAETSEPRSNAALDQRIVIRRGNYLGFFDLTRCCSSRKPPITFWKLSSISAASPNHLVIECFIFVI